MAYQPDLDVWTGTSRLLAWITGDRVQAALAVLTLVVIGVYGLSGFLYHPYDGFTLAPGPGAVVASIEPGGPAAQAGMKPGDRVLRVAASPVNSDLEEPLYTPGTRPGTAVAYQIERKGKTLQVILTLGNLWDHLGWIAVPLAFMILSLLFWGVGLVLGLKRGPGPFQRRLLAALFWFGGAGLAACGPGNFAHFWVAGSVASATGLVCGFLLLSTHLIYPVPLFSARIRKHLVNGASGLVGLFAVVILARDFFPRQLLFWLPQLGNLATWVTMGYLAISVLASLGLLGWGFFKEGEPEIRQSALVLFAGILLGPSSWLALFLFPQPGFLSRSYPVLFLGIVPLVYLAVVLRISPGSSKWGLRKSSAWIVPGALLLAAWVLFCGTGSLVFGQPGWVGIGIGLLAWFGFWPVALFHGRPWDLVKLAYWPFEAADSSLSDQLEEAMDRESVEKLLTRGLEEGMEIRRVALLLPGEGSFSWVGKDSPDLAFPAPDEIRLYLQGHTEPVSARRLMNRFPAAPGDGLWWNQLAWVHLFLPLVHHQVLWGVLLLDERQYGGGYSRGDLRILTTIGKEAGRALSRAQVVEGLRAHARELIHQAEQERAGVIRDLHDGVVQDLCLVQQGLYRLPGQERLAAHLEIAIDRLRAAIDAGDSHLVRSSLGIALSALVEEHKGLLLGVQTILDYRSNIEDEELQLPGEEVTQIFRIVQEALANAIRHAHARRITIRVQGMGDDALRISVEDDGLGMPASGQPELLAGKHFGLSNMKERAAIVGASLSIQSRSGMGTTISIEIKR